MSAPVFALIMVFCVVGFIVPAAITVRDERRSVATTRVAGRRMVVSMFSIIAFVVISAIGAGKYSALGWFVACLMACYTLLVVSVFVLAFLVLVSTVCDVKR